MKILLQPFVLLKLCLFVCVVRSQFLHKDSAYASFALVHPITHFIHEAQLATFQSVTEMVYTMFKNEWKYCLPENCLKIKCSSFWSVQHLRNNRCSKLCFDGPESLTEYSCNWQIAKRSFTDFNISLSGSHLSSRFCYPDVLIIHNASFISFLIDASVSDLHTY